MISTLTIVGVACSTVAGMGFGIAAVVREVYRGKAALLLAQRGEPLPPRDKSTLPSIRRKS